MTNPNEMGTVDRTSRAELPVWQPPRLPAELLAADPGTTWNALAPDDAALDPIPGEPAGDEANVARAGWAANSSTPSRRTNSAPAFLVVSALIAVCGVGFAAGRVTAQGQSATGQPGGGGGGGGIAAVQSTVPGSGARATSAPVLAPGEPGNGLASGTTVVSGTVTSVTPNSITVEQADGRTVTIGIGPSTTYATQTAATAADVIPGARVVVQTTGSGGRERVPGGFGDANRGAATRTATSVTITSN
jgi:hypothetical protein